METNPQNKIIFEDSKILVINKLQGFEVQRFQEENLFVINRLDQRVSGLVLLAKDKETAAKLSFQLQNHEILKKYKAVISSKPDIESGNLTHWLLKDEKRKLSKVFDKEVKKSRKSELNYQLTQSSEKYFLLEIELITGRFHQIRSQLAHIGCPILGDLKYGFKRSSPDGSIFLQSYFLQFNHPDTKERMTFELEIPEIWKKFGFV